MCAERDIVHGEFAGNGRPFHRSDFFRFVEDILGR